MVYDSYCCLTVAWPVMQDTFINTWSVLIVSKRIQCPFIKKNKKYMKNESFYLIFSFLHVGGRRGVWSKTCPPNVTKCFQLFQLYMKSIAAFKIHMENSCMLDNVLIKEIQNFWNFENQFFMSLSRPFGNSQCAYDSWINFLQTNSNCVSSYICISFLH